MTRTCSRTIILTISNNKIMKKDGSGYRHFKRNNGVFHLSFACIEDKKQHAGKCFLAKIYPLNEVYNSYFDILKNPNHTT